MITVWFQKYKYDKERKPIISPLVKKYELTIVDILTDWETRRKVDKKWSEITFQLKNFGKEPVIDMNYRYSFKNYEIIKTYLKNIQLNNECNLELKEPTFIKRKKELLLKEASLTGIDGEMKINYKISRPILNGNPISPEKEIEVNLPSYFIILTNFLLKNPNSRLDFFSLSSIPFPKLELTIYCKDTDQRIWMTVYELYWDSRMSSSLGINGGHYQLILNSKHTFTKKMKKRNIFLIS
ncbi:hypothetical protein GCM10010954_01350 [Halobacillus andaensis]|uniref:Uncharacterized protein n=1 Tax=Halobacillus andaensis TaxID=1176239 RepID=A0A917EUH5_HALAA|nr:hypothetical protein GCM10010954_01350 [Halobacillus andaensis]